MAAFFIFKQSNIIIEINQTLITLYFSFENL